MKPRFPMRFSRVSDYLPYARIFTSKDAALEFAAQLRPSVMLVDDKLVSMAKRVDVPIIAAERIRYKTPQKADVTCRQPSELLQSSTSGEAQEV